MGSAKNRLVRFPIRFLILLSRRNVTRLEITFGAPNSGIERAGTMGRIYRKLMANGLCSQIKRTGRLLIEPSCSYLILRCSCNFLRFEDNFLLAGQLVLHFLDDQPQVTRV